MGIPESAYGGRPDPAGEPAAGTEDMRADYPQIRAAMRGLPRAASDVAAARYPDAGTLGLALRGSAVAAAGAHSSAAFADVRSALEKRLLALEAAGTAAVTELVLTDSGFAELLGEVLPGREAG